MKRLFPPYYGGYLDADLKASSTQPRMAVPSAGERFRMLPAPLLLPQSGGCGRLTMWAGTLPRMPECGSEKRTAEHPGGTRSSVGVKGRYRRQNLRRLPGQTPVTGAASVPDEVRNAAARAFFSYTIKRRILFFLSRKKRMGVLPRGGAASLRASPALPRPGTGRKTKGAASAAPCFPVTSSPARPRR